MMNEVLEGVTINTQKFEVCYNPDRIFDVLGSLDELKRAVVQRLRYLGTISGRLPRNWPSTPEQKQQFLSQSREHYFLRVCMTNLNDGKHPAHIPIIKTTKNGKKRETNLSWLYDQLSDIGLRINSYEDLMKRLIDRQKNKKP